MSDLILSTTSFDVLHQHLTTLGHESSAFRKRILRPLSNSLDTSEETSQFMTNFITTMEKVPKASFHSLHSELTTLIETFRNFDGNVFNQKLSLLHTCLSCCISGFRTGVMEQWHEYLDELAALESEGKSHEPRDFLNQYERIREFYEHNTSAMKELMSRLAQLCEDLLKTVDHVQISNMLTSLEENVLDPLNTLDKTWDQLTVLNQIQEEFKKISSNISFYCERFAHIPKRVDQIVPLVSQYCDLLLPMVELMESHICRTKYSKFLDHVEETAKLSEDRLKVIFSVPAAIQCLYEVDHDKIDELEEEFLKCGSKAHNLRVTWKALTNGITNNEELSIGQSVTKTNLNNIQEMVTNMKNKSAEYSDLIKKVENELTKVEKVLKNPNLLNLIGGNVKNMEKMLENGIVSMESQMMGTLGLSDEIAPTKLIKRSVDTIGSFGTTVSEQPVKLIKKGVHTVESVGDVMVKQPTTKIKNTVGKGMEKLHLNDLDLVPKFEKKSPRALRKLFGKSEKAHSQNNSSEEESTDDIASRTEDVETDRSEHEDDKRDSNILKKGINMITDDIKHLNEKAPVKAIKKGVNKIGDSVMHNKPMDKLKHFSSDLKSQVKLPKTGKLFKKKDKKSNYSNMDSDDSHQP